MSESFVVSESRDTVWQVIGNIERVARCLPGVEDVTQLDGGYWNVRITQSLGPMTATFDAKLHVTEQHPAQSISFAATGRTVRGAVGNVRLTNTVHLEDEPDGSTRVLLEADVAMGGMLGSVGQKVIGRQAAAAAKQFAEALQGELRNNG